MSTPLTRAEFEERINFLCEQLRKGKMHFAQGLVGQEGLLKVRYLPNKRIDLLSIDESTRLNANTTYEMQATGLAERLMALQDDKEA